MIQDSVWITFVAVQVPRLKNFKVVFRSLTETATRSQIFRCPSKNSFPLYTTNVFEIPYIGIVRLRDTVTVAVAVPVLVLRVVDYLY